MSHAGATKPTTPPRRLSDTELQNIQRRIMWALAANHAEKVAARKPTEAI